MKISILKEEHPDETRVAISPDMVKKYVSLGFDVSVQKDAGHSSHFSDEALANAGATICADLSATIADADIILSVRTPEASKLAGAKEGAVVIGLFDPHNNSNNMQAYAEQKLQAVSIEMLPRITRGQSMDVLSSQANLAGYKAVIDAVAQYERALPMMMTAAGTIPAARVFIMGAGVAGLQAIATAKRLGAIVSATDVRPATKEQVESLGGKFVAVEDEEFAQAQTAGGYAKQMSAEYQAKQAELIAQTISKQDIVITTAQIPGRKAPVLVTSEMVSSMKSGSVLLDLAVEQGGNVEGSKAGETVNIDGVKIIGHKNIPGRLASDASSLYARNLFNYVSLFVTEGAVSVPYDDELVAKTLLTKGGAIVHEAFAPKTEENTTEATAS